MLFHKSGLAFYHTECESQLKEIQLFLKYKDPENLSFSTYVEQVPTFLTKVEELLVFAKEHQNHMRCASSVLENTPERDFYQQFTDIQKDEFEHLFTELSTCYENIGVYGDIAVKLMEKNVSNEKWSNQVCKNVHNKLESVRILLEKLETTSEQMAVLLKDQNIDTMKNSANEHDKVYLENIQSWF
ncbi:MAG: hypothetical protein ACI8Y7_001163 [Candidatus Woesearchaeota archaeon]|jgi:hypothetical protein